MYYLHTSPGTAVFKPIPLKKAITATIVTLALTPAAQAAETWHDFTRNSGRITPTPGMLLADLRHTFGEPSITHIDLGSSATEVWDYGTFRAFVSDGIVQRAKLW